MVDCSVCVPLSPELDSKYYTTPVNAPQFKAIRRDLSPLNEYFQLGRSDYPGIAGPIINFNPNTTIANLTSNYLQSSTALLTGAVPSTCCGTSKKDSSEHKIFGYWTPIFTHDDAGESLPSGRDIVVKTLCGPAAALYDGLGVANAILWPQPPNLAIIRCIPIIETALSTVTVDVSTRAVRGYTLLDAPVSFEAAWSNNYLSYNIYIGNATPTYMADYTLSFGPLFMSILLGAAQLTLLGGYGDGSGR